VLHGALASGLLSATRLGGLEDWEPRPETARLAQHRLALSRAAYSSDSLYTVGCVLTAEGRPYSVSVSWAPAPKRWSGVLHIDNELHEAGPLGSELEALMPAGASGVFTVRTRIGDALSTIPAAWGFGLRTAMLLASRGAARITPRFAVVSAEDDLAAIRLSPDVRIAFEQKTSQAAVRSGRWSGFQPAELDAARDHWAQGGRVALEAGSVSGALLFIEAVEVA